MRIALAVQPDRADPADLVGGLTVAVPAIVRQASGRPPVCRPTPTCPLLPICCGCRTVRRSTLSGLPLWIVYGHGRKRAECFGVHRIVASTRASLVSSTLAAWCAFTGALRGAAPGPTLDRLDAAEAAPDPGAWLEAKLRAGRG
jgi:citrate synthase